MPRENYGLNFGEEAPRLGRADVVEDDARRAEKLQLGHLHSCSRFNHRIRRTNIANMARFHLPRFRKRNVKPPLLFFVTHAILSKMNEPRWTRPARDWDTLSRTSRSTRVWTLILTYTSPDTSAPAPRARPAPRRTRDTYPRVTARKTPALGDVSQSTRLEINRRPPRRPSPVHRLPP